MSKKMLTIRIPEEIDKRLERLAKRTNRTKTFYAREAIIEHLNELEDYYLAFERLEKGRPAISIEEVERQLGLDD